MSPVVRCSALLAVLATTSLVSPAPLASQPSTTSAPAPSVAALNAEARRLSELDPEQALRVADRALSEARRQKDASGEAEAHHNLAVAYQQLGALDLAVGKAQTSIAHYAAIGDRKGEAQGYNTLGLIASNRGEYARSLEHHLRALSIRQEIDDKVGLAYSYNNLGNVYRSLKDYDKALDYHRQAVALKVTLGDKISEAYSYHNMGNVYRDMGDMPRALEAYRRGLALREAAGDVRGIGASLNSIGQIEEQTNPRAALATYERTLEVRRRTQDRRGEAATYTNIGHVHLTLGETTQAIAVLTRALAITQDIDAPVVRVETLRVLSDAEAARGDYRAALARFREHVELQRSLFDTQTAQRVGRLEAAHENLRREQELALLQKDAALGEAALARQQLVRNGLIVALGLVSICLALLYARYRLRRQSEARFRAQAEELAEALANVRTLRGLLPICAACKKIRDDNGYWTQVERFVRDRSDADFTHSICPECIETMYPELASEPPASS